MYSKKDQNSLKGLLANLIDKVMVNNCIYKVDL